MTRGSTIKSNRGGHGRASSQKSLNFNKMNPYVVLEGVPEGGVQRKISDFTESNLKKRPLSPEKSSTTRAKKPNYESNPNLEPLGTRPSKPNGSVPSPLGDQRKDVNDCDKPPSPIRVNEVVVNPTSSPNITSSYASVASGSTAGSSEDITHVTNRATRPHEASDTALAFEPSTAQLCEALITNKDDKLNHVFSPLVKFIENATRLIDAQAERIESMSSTLGKQNEELSFLRGKVIELEGGVKCSNSNASYMRQKSEKASVKDQFETAQKVIRVVNIEKKGRQKKSIISDTIDSLKLGTKTSSSFEEVSCFGKSDSDVCTVTLKCRSKEDKVSMEKKGKDAGLDLRHHVPKNFVRTVRELREAYLNNDFKGAIPKSNRLIMIRPNQGISGLQVHMKSKSEGGKWTVIEYLNFPLSQNCLRELGGKQPMRSNLINISNVFIPSHL